MFQKTLLFQPSQRKRSRVNMSRLIYLVLLALLVQLATVTSIEITTAMDEATIDRYILEPKLNKPGVRPYMIMINTHS